MEDTTLSLSMRPTCLADVVGHEKIVSSIEKQLSTGRTPKGWILAGPPGVGKTTLAQIIGERLNAPDPAEVTYLNAATSNGVDAIRDLVATADYLPMTGKQKVFILDEAQQLTPQAQNAFLIPLEKSPAVFIFPTTDPTKLLPTLRDRCMQYDLKPFTAKELDQLAARATDRLGIDVIEGFGELAVRSGVTSPRVALMAIEKYAGGIPLKQALTRPEHAPEYADVARKVLSGNWTGVQEALSQIKTADIGGLRSVLAAFFRSALLKGAPGPRNAAIASALIELGNAAPHEQGVAYAVLTAVLYRLSQELTA
jgi:Holliday junction resolvasome RuvABC ATP-dependent DNA helicase subunit